MRLVTAFPAVIVSAVSVVGAVFSMKTLPRGPGLNQRAVHGEALIAHELLGARNRFREELPRRIGSRQPVAVLGKHRAIPRRIVHAQAHKPTEQQVVIDLLDQQTLRKNRIKHLRQSRPRNILRSCRCTPGVGIQLVKFRRPKKPAQRPSACEFHAADDPPEPAAATKHS